MPFPKAIITKPFLISDSEYKDLGLNINLVGYDSFSQIAENTKQHVSPRLLNWVEPYEISGERKSLFYTEVNTNFQVGDKVYILNGNYDNDSLIKKDKYKKGRDGYKVLKMDQCKVVLDIDYTGVLPYNNDSFDDYIKIYYINDSEKFLSANRQVTTRGGKFDYKFNYYQNNISFIDKNLKGIDGWGLNAGVSGTPGFFVREERQGWSKISDELVYLGSFSVALSPTYSNNGKIVIMDGSFEYNGIQFKEGFVYRWEVGPTSSAWQVDQECSPAIITKSNFRNGTFNGKFNNGLYGTQKNKLDWNGKGTWNGGTMVNTRWKSGTIDSKLNFVSTYKAVFDEYGIPFQKSYTNNNGGFGFNYIFDSEIEKSLVNNGNFYNTSFEQAATFSVVENHVLSITQSFDNKIVKAHFELCNFKNIQIEGGELKNTRSFNSKISNVKSINSYFEKSVLKDSTYVSDEIIKILGYDEWNMSEYFSSFSGSFSSIKDVNNKIYKFYISKENFKRLKSEDVFYIKGLKINNSPTLTNFFDNKFRLTSWTEFYDDYSTRSKTMTGVDPYSFYKRGYECSAFLSTPEENAYVINSYEGLYNVSGVTVSKYTSVLSGTNSKATYSIDIVVSRHDLLNKNQSMDSTSEWDSLNPKNYNYDSDVIVGTTSLPTYLGNNIDISTAYILDSDFGSGIIETSDWNSGYHINYNNDVVITSVTSSGIYNLEIDNYNDYLIAYTNMNHSNPEKIGNSISKDDVIFLNSIDYDTRGMVTHVTLIATGSSYSSSSDPIFLVNTKVESLTMSNVGTYYKKDTGLITYNKTGKGTGLTIDVDAKEIGAVLGITYSAPMSGGGSYSMNFNSSVSTSTGPISTSTFVFNILTDDSLGTVTGITPAQNNGDNATYSVFGPPLTVSASGATGVGAIFVTGPLTTSPNGATNSISLGIGLTLNYKTSANGAITYLEINNPGSGYEVGQVFKVEGGGATFSIKSISKGEIISYKINNPGEDYLKGDILEIIKPFDPNFQFGTGITASVVVTSITVSSSDTKGLSLDILAVPGTGYISNISINGPGLYYTEGDIFTINDGNLDALVRIDSVTGSVIRLNDTYKVLENDKGKIILKDLGVQNIIAGLTARGIFYTTDAKNRWGYLSKTKIDKTKIKSGLFKRSYITNSLIRDINYDSTDRNFNNLTKIKNLVISDSLFSNNSNILSSATYLYSNIVGGTDIWNDGIINKSVINGLTFSKGTIKQSTWIDGNFTGGMFFFSKSFDAMPTIDRPNYLSNRVRSYYMTGELGATLSNNRYSWRNGKLSGGQFYKSDWENGVMNNGLFFYSKFYSGTINGGKIGTKEVSSTDTRVYNGLINYTTVDNAHVYSEDTSFTGLSSSNIVWMNGIFNKGVFGSNNDDILGTTFSHLSYATTFTTSMPIADFKITIASQNVTDVNPILGDFEIDVRTTIKHTYLGDLIINLMSPNGKIINLKKRYSCGSNDNLLSTVFSSDSTKPNIEIGTTPYTGEFKFDALLNQGVYYDLNNNLLPNIQYREEGAIIPEVIDYRSQPPATVYEGDRYLVIATASDPNWIAPATSSPYSNPWVNLNLVGKVVEWKATNNILSWKEYSPENNDKLFIKNKSEYLKYIVSAIFKGWAKSYHSNTTKILDLLNNNKTVTGNWKMMIMDCASLDSGFVEEFEITFNYKTSYIIKSFKNDAVWNNGIFNGGQFIDLGVWKNGTFNGGKFISTFGYKKSGSYLVPSKNELEYSWQNGIFNGGEFGNESLLSNSTWYNGEFNDGVFKGKLWNNGVFTYGEFKGGSSVPAIGNGIKSANAQIFMESFKNEYYGVWLSGVVSDKKDNFVTNKKLFTKPLRAMAPVKLGKTAKFTNMLWASGTFNHPSGEIKNSIWLNGLFKMGNFKSSAFNPYVTRRSDKQEFVKDDSCIWENGKLIDSEFHMSKWTYGQFISGTAVGMIWKNGISNYMNAYNIFWENGVWRNGNWYGSNFEYRGKVEDGFTKEILNRGIEWSGTSSCHIWNLFESDVDTTSSIATTSILNAAGDSFTTTNLDDAGYSIPSINNLIITKIDATSVKAEFTIVANGGAPIKEVGFIYTTNTTGGAAANNTPNISVSNQIGTGFSGTTVKATVATPPTYTFTTGVSTTGIPIGTFEVNITGLQPNLSYTIKGYAINSESNTSGAALTPNMIVFQTVQPNTVTFNSNLMPTTPTNGEVYTGAGNTWQQGVRKSITIPASYNSTTSQPAPTGSNSKGIVYIVQDIGVTAPTNLPTVDNNTVIYFTTGTGTTYTTTIPITTVVANKVYYIRAFTINASGPGYSDLITITSGVDLPTLGTTTVTTDLTGNLSNTGGSTTIQRGFIISSTNTALITKPSTIAETSLSGGSGMVRINIDTNATITSFTKTINTISVGLTPAIQYYVRAYVYNTTYDYDNCNAFAYSNILPFISAATQPGVTTNNVVLPLNITENGANLSGTIVNANGNVITDSGFVYTTNAGSGYPTGTNAPSTMATNTSSLGYFNTTTLSGIFNKILTNLDSGQKYFFKAYVTNGIGTGYGEEKTFTTLAKITTTLISTATTITPTIAITSVISSGTAAPTTRGIIWNTSTFTPATAATLTTTRTTNTNTVPGPSPATGLTPNTKYYLRGYVTNVSGTYYEAVVEKITLPAFISTGLTNTPTTAAETANIVIGAVGAVGNVIQGNQAISEKGIAYGTSQTPTTTTQAALIPTGLIGYTTNITGLTIGTKYYYRPYVINAAGISYGTESDFTTLASVQLPVIGSITYNMGALSVIGTIINAGGQSILGSGLCYSFTPLPLASGNHKINTGNNLTFDTNIPFAVPDIGTITHYIRAYVNNAGGTAYSTQTIKLVIDAGGTGIAIFEP